MNILMSLSITKPVIVHYPLLHYFSSPFVSSLEDPLHQCNLIWDDKLKLLIISPFDVSKYSWQRNSKYWWVEATHHRSWWTKDVFVLQSTQVLPSVFHFTLSTKPSFLNAFCRSWTPVGHNLSVEWVHVTEYSVASEKASLVNRLSHVSNLGKTQS